MTCYQQTLFDVQCAPRVERKRAPVDPEYEFMYYSGHDSVEVREAAERRSDIGIVVTPNTSHMTERIRHYPSAIVDNGAFQKGGFQASGFLRLLDRIGDHDSAWDKIKFVVAPDVVCDPVATLYLFEEWAPAIRDRGFKVALAAQNGLEDMTEFISWDEIDALFIGGDTEWKMGTTGNETAWDALLKQASDLGKHIHFGRVNSMRRMDFASWMGAASADGTFTKFAAKENIKRLEKFLDEINTCEVFYGFMAIEKAKHDFNTKVRP